MEQDPMRQEIASAEHRVAKITDQLERAKEDVRQWIDANASHSRSAAEARAKNQSMGRGLIGGLLGSKYRSAMRSIAASSNATIAKDVAKKRAKNAEGKREAQEVARHLQSELKIAKQELKSLTLQRKAKSKNKSALIETASKSLSLLQKLKEAYDAGVLTEQEYEDKRKKLVSGI